jgi:DNA-binding NtrC family response regulator
VKKIILLAEDDPEISSFLKKHISTLLRRCSVIVANDGTSVMDICRRTKPDVVLLNYYLPNAQGGKVSGIGLMLLAFVRQQCPNARVVMLTGEDSVDVAFQAGRLGSFAFVSKPFEIEKFDEILRNALADEVNLILNL